LEELVTHLQNEYNLNAEHIEMVSHALKFFVSTFQKKWKKSLYIRNNFEKGNEKWLNSDFVLDFAKKKTTGRKLSSREFEELSVATKRRRLISMEENYSNTEIEEAFFRMLRNNGKLKLANIIKTMLNENDEKSENCDKQPCISYSVEEALALIEDVKLSKYQYKIIRQQAKERNADIYPDYNKVLEAKKECYPSQILTSEVEARINLQSLIDHTVLRLFKDPNLCFSDIDNSEKICNLDFIIKYGCDGASGQRRYNQKFPGINSTDETVFTVSMVPLSLKEHSKSTIVWNNPHPASPKRCIPIFFIFAKETKDRTKQEIQLIKDQIEKLQPTKLTVSDITFVVHAKMHLTMVDGKVCQALSDTPSSATCYICGAKPSEMNYLERVKEKRDNTSHFEFGLSTLHAWIRFMECILHIGYRLDFCKRFAATDEQKQMKNKAKERICTEFREKLGLLVDQPNQGTGNTNNGNTARRFFSDPDLTSKVTRVNVELIKRFGQILKILASSTKVPIQFFDKFAFETAELYVRLYPWFFMPVSVHKILLHGGKVMQDFLLPIGQYSEEAAEARNKDFKRFREFHTRKYSRLVANQDIIHKLLVSSDLYIASLRQQWKKPEDEIDNEIVQLIQQYQ